MATSATRMQTAAKPAQSISQSIAEHVVGCGYSALPASSITAAKRLMLDTLAVGWAGTSAPGAPEAHGLLTEEGGRGDSSLWGFGGKLPPAQATFLNSISGGALDYDGVNTVHAEIVALPAALSIAEREHSSGKDFLAAFVIASDLCSRFGDSITGTHKGWFTTSIYGGFGAAAAAAKLLKLDATATRHALGIALSQAAGTQQSNIEQALTKRFQGALAARSGVFSALLAQRGITAPREAIEGKFGLFALYQEGNPLKILGGLGQRFEHENTAIKKYPCCACSHASLEAAFGLIREYDLKPDDVSAIEVTPCSFRMSAITSPSRASDGAVRKNRPSSSAVDKAGEVAEGDTITMPFGRATFCKTAPVTPEQSPPMMPLTASDVTIFSAAVWAAAASTQVESPRTDVNVQPFSALPEAFTSAIAASAALAMWPVKDSIGPVKPIKIPSFTSSAEATEAQSAVAAVASSSFFIFNSHVGSQSCL